MITKLANAKDNWFFKILSAAVAISFISLFGVTGYINTASRNQTVVKINKKKITQSEFSYRLQKEINALKKIAGDDFELTDELRTSLTESVLKQIINENVIRQTMDKYGVHFPRALVQQVILRQPEFQNPANGQFHPDLFKRYLSSVGMSEQEYVENIERAMAQKMLISDLIYPFNVPNVLSQAVHKMDNQRKSFKYALVSPQDVKIERKISDDEIQQYFADFGEDFMVPEKRDAKVLFVSNEQILKKYATSDDLVSDYFKEHKKELDQPEKREILQMVFMDKTVAEDAYNQVQKAKNFADVAKDLKAENANEPTLGLVSQDELAEDLADPAFEMKVGESRLLQVADTWQVIQVKQVVEAKPAVLEEVKPQIVEILTNENMYDAIREAKAFLDDTVNSGKSLEEVAQLMGADVIEVKDIAEETPVKNVPTNLKDLSSSLDFNELVFSYGLDEITSAEEFDTGVAVVQVVNIVDAHMPEIDDVKDEIKALWTVQEKDALAKETADNIVADIEDGTDIATAAKARDLEVFRSEPISRNEVFAGLTPLEINELFTADLNTVKMFEHTGNHYIIAVPFDIVNYNDELTDDALKYVQDRVSKGIFSDMSQAALDSYADNFKIKVDYKRVGFEE